MGSAAPAGKPLELIRPMLATPGPRRRMTAGPPSSSGTEVCRFAESCGSEKRNPNVGRGLQRGLGAGLCR